MACIREIFGEENSRRLILPIGIRTLRYSECYYLGMPGNALDRAIGSRQLASQDPTGETREPLITDLLSRLKKGESPYAEVIARFSSSSMTTNYGSRTAELYRNNDPELREIVDYLKRKLEGETLIDLGGSSDMLVFDLGLKVKASATLSVDKYLDEPRVNEEAREVDWDQSRPAVQDPFTNIRDRLNPKFRWDFFEKKYPDELRDYLVSNYDVENLPEYGIVCDDMLDFVSRLPDDSANFMMNGIDGFILTGSSEYKDALAREIVRTLKPGGIVFGSSFWAVSEKFKGLGLERLFQENESLLDREFFEKKVG